MGGLQFKKKIGLLLARYINTLQKWRFSTVHCNLWYTYSSPTSKIKRFCPTEQKSITHLYLIELELVNLKK